jgi:hypothetical protein
MRADMGPGGWVSDWIKRCIFCGEAFTGQKKNFEHIIPRWLAEEADLNRRDMEVNLPNRTLKVGMGRIGLKVCTTCNDADSGLEGAAKQAYLALKAGADLTDDEIHTLLDWLDKIRVGLWLWLIESTKDGRPKFRINQRIAVKDRLLLVRRYPEGPPMKGLSIMGLGEFFLGMPSAMGLLINNVAVVSLSTDFLVTRHIRDVKVKMTFGGGDQDGFDFIGDHPNEPRLSMLGGPSIFGQCILPTDDFATLAIPVRGASKAHEGLSESVILRFDAQLREAPGAPTNVPTFDGNVYANTVLMELNVMAAAGYMVRDLQRSETGLIDADYLRTITRNTAIALGEIDDSIEVLKHDYLATTGLRLP